ncbi:helix-turn-helix transcriptional regulator [Actinophytocola sp.]|uniref:helix-turn-helix transcriptional regulator n=1 Tax=Actinophytocola sp. TaxID=1872138 RepID=UPI002ED09E18
MLEAIGLTADQERVYRVVLTMYRARPAELADRVGLGMDAVAGVLSSLHDLGLLSRTGRSEYMPVPPDAAFGPLLLRGQEALEAARGSVHELVDTYRVGARRRDSARLVEVITGAAAIRQQVMNMQLGARSDLRWFCRSGHVAMPSEDNAEEFEALARGVSYRVLYETALVEEPGMIENIERGVRHGEIARATSTLPIRLMIADSAVALCPLVQHTANGDEPTAALVHDSSLLAALIALFEAYWERGSPLRFDGAPVGPLAGDERQLLSLLVAGVTDKAIATQLRVSQRTVQRRIYELMRRTGADTRIQLGWEASRLGWLDGLPHAVRT